MIKINLLGDALAQAMGKKPEKIAEAAPVYADQGGGGATTLPVLGIVAGLVFASLGGVYYLWLNGKIKDAEVKVAKLQEEKRELDKYIKLEAEFQKKKISLQKKKEAILKLKNAQKLPVHLLEELANCLPDDVWFREINQKGMAITIKGESSSFEAINIFRGKLLEQNTWFKNVNYPIAGKKTGVVDFTISFDLKNLD